MKKLNNDEEKGEESEEHGEVCCLDRFSRCVVLQARIFKFEPRTNFFETAFVMSSGGKKYIQ